MTCTSQSSMNHTKGSGLFQNSQQDLDKAKAECLVNENCTGVRTNYCSTHTKNTDLYFDFCNDDVVPSDQVGTTIGGLFGGSYVPAICVHKKRDGMCVCYL